MKTTNKPLHPRKKPSQSRSVQTVQVILDGAAHILETGGLEAYKTNEIAARSGVSIGSLYQYFSCRDAITIALIKQETAILVEEAMAALALPDAQQMMLAMIDAAVRHQLRRPKLARLLDFEEARLARSMPEVSNNARILGDALVAFLIKHHAIAPDRAGAVAMDLMELIRALTDAAGRREEADPVHLTRSIRGAVNGYLQAVARPM